MTRSSVIVLGALVAVLCADHALAQLTSAAPGEPTISKHEIWRSLYPNNPNDPNNPNATNDPHNPSNANDPANPDNPADIRYRWSYSRTDPLTGGPLELADGDSRRVEIDEYRVDCIKLVSRMFDENGLPDHIPRSQFNNLEDQATEMVLGCVNKLHLQRERWMKGVGAIVCEAHTGQCWGPGDVWVKPPASTH